MLKSKSEDKIFQIQRIYAKDISFETLNTPDIFQQKWDPEVKCDLDTTSKILIKHIYEVILHIKITTTINKIMAFICEIQQVGIFYIYKIEKNEINNYVNIHCPNILFPYASECIANLVNRGTFPPLNLTSINLHLFFAKKNKK